MVRKFLLASCRCCSIHLRLEPSTAWGMVAELLPWQLPDGIIPNTSIWHNFHLLSFVEISHTNMWNTTSFTNMWNTTSLSWPTAFICSQKEAHVFSKFEVTSKLVKGYLLCMLILLHSCPISGETKLILGNLIVNLVFSHVFTGSCQDKTGKPILWHHVKFGPTKLYGVEIKTTMKRYCCGGVFQDVKRGSPCDASAYPTPSSPGTPNDERQQ